MNPFKSVVERAYKKPNLILAVIFALLPPLFSLLLFVIYNFPIDYVIQGYALLRAIVVLIASGAILYVLLYILKGKAVQGKFSGVLTALSFMYLIRVILLIVCVAVVFVMAPAFFPTLSEISRMELTAEQFLDYMESIPVQGGLIALAGTAFVIIASIGGILAIIYLLYQVIARSAPSGKLINIIVLLILLFFLFLIELILP